MPCFILGFDCRSRTLTLAPRRPAEHLSTDIHTLAELTTLNQAANPNRSLETCRQPQPPHRCRDDRHYITLNPRAAVWYDDHEPSRSPDRSIRTTIRLSSPILLSSDSTSILHPWYHAESQVQPYFTSAAIIYMLAHALLSPANPDLTLVLTPCLTPRHGTHSARLKALMSL